MIQRTFDAISELLDELDGIKETQRLMIGMGSVSRTNAGFNFFKCRMNRQMEILEELNQYPYEWIEGVKHALTIIENPNIKSRVPLI